jgi:hypothetical protein
MQVDHGQWHLKKEVTLGTLLAIVVYAVVMLTFIIRMDGRMTNLEVSAVDVQRMAIAETRIQTNKENTDKLEARTLLALDEIKNALRRIEERQERGVVR